MNVFEFLGFSANHRVGDNITQLTKHFAEVNPKAEEGKLHKLVQFPLYVQEKEDGNCAILVCPPNTDEVALFNRRGSRFTNVEDVELYFRGARELGILSHGVYLGELVSYDCSLEQLSGVVNPNRKDVLDEMQKLIKHRLRVKFFDCVSVDEFITGTSHNPFTSRHSQLLRAMDGIADVLMYQVARDYTDLERMAKYVISKGCEGIVARNDYDWSAGHKGYRQMKWVRHMSVDIKCIGYEEGKGKMAGKIGNLLFDYKGKKLKAALGKGWTHSMNEDMFYSAESGLDSPVGRIFEVYGLQPSSKNGLIRLPKVGELRHDKVQADF